MKTKMKTENLPLAVLLLGAAAAVSRGALYLTAVDDKGLIIRGHIAGWLLWLVCAAAAAVIGISVRNLKGSDAYALNFDRSMPAAAGCFALAAGVVLTLLAGNSVSRSLLAKLWYPVGVLAAGGLIWAGLDRMRGKQPSVLPLAAVCLFLALHTVSRYQPWSGNPQAQDWVFSLLAAAALTLSAYHHAAFCADAGHRRLLLGTSLAAVFCCCAALPHTEYFALYLCGGIWAFTGLCRVMPVSEEKEIKEKE